MYIVKRPVSASVIGWIAIIFGGLHLIGALVVVVISNTSYYDSYIVASVFYIIVTLSALISGIALLKGKKWSKAILSLICISLILFTITSAVKDYQPVDSSSLGILLYSFSIMMIVAPAAVILVFLQNKKIKDYLNKGNN